MNNDDQNTIYKRCDRLLSFFSKVLYMTENKTSTEVTSNEQDKAKVVAPAPVAAPVEPTKVEPATATPAKV